MHVVANAMSVAFRLLGKHGTTSGKPLGRQPWCHQRLKETRDHVIVFA
jgi:hypothetical protein